MTTYPQFLTDGQPDARKVRVLAIRRARYERDLILFVDNGFSHDGHVGGLSTIAAFRRAAVRPLMIAGQRELRAADIFAAALASTLEDAQAAARNVARWNGATQ
jgi:hypothetical protein